MKDTLFDDLVRSKLDLYDSPVPAQSWNAIADALRKNKRRRFAFWWWNGMAPALLLMAVGTIGYMVWSKNQSNNQLTAPGINTKQPSSAANSAPGTNNTQPGITVINTSTLSTSKETVSSNNNSNPLNNSTTDKNISKQNFNTGSNNNTADVTGNNPVNNSVLIHFPGKRPGRIKKAKDSFSFTGMATVTREDLINNSNDAASSNSMDNNQAEMNFSLAMLKANDLTATPSPLTSINLRQGSINCPSIYGIRRNDWYLDAYVAPVLVSRTLTAAGSPNQNAVNKKDSSETMRISYNAGVNIVKNIGNRLLLKTGLNYSLTNEKFTYSKINSIQNITIITVKKIPRGPGDTIYVYDTATIQQIGRLTKKVTNRYHSFDVPLILGYETQGENIRFNINAGVIFNITTLTNGQTLNNADSIVSIKSSGFYKNNIGIGLYGSVMMLKKINDHLDFYVEPYIRQNLGNMATNKAYFKQTFRSTGLNVGIRLKLN